MYVIQATVSDRVEALYVTRNEGVGFQAEVFQSREAAEAVLAANAKRLGRKGWRLEVVAR